MLDDSDVSSKLEVAVFVLSIVALLWYLILWVFGIIGCMTGYAKVPFLAPHRWLTWLQEETLPPSTALTTGHSSPIDSTRRIYTSSTEGFRYKPF